MDERPKPGMLAYVFWHIARAGTDPDVYEERLVRFHESLSADPLEGLRASASFRHYALPWAPSSLFVYEDWYVVESFADLGTLNEVAASGNRKGVHDAVADGSAWGAGGLYASRGRPMLAGEYSYWFAKPSGTTYEGLVERLDSIPIEQLWRRQMALGPAPEFGVLSETRTEFPDLDVFESSSYTVYTSA